MLFQPKQPHFSAFRA